MPLGPALTTALHATTLEVARAAGRYDAVVVGAGAAGGTGGNAADRGGLARAGARRRPGSIADPIVLTAGGPRPDTPYFG